MIISLAESAEGKIKKASFEAVSYAAALAGQLNTQVCAVLLNETPQNEIELLAKYGADKIIYAPQNNTAIESWSTVLGEIAKDQNANTIVISNSYTGKAIAPRLAAQLKAGITSGVVSLPDTSNGFVVKKSAFSGKAFAYVNIKSDKKVLAITPNSYKLVENPKAPAIETIQKNAEVKTESVDVKKSTGKISLPEAELVVSGGRGLKGPENWNLIEDLANALEAGMACSKPVSDMDWRPHEEHVGQTGITIKPNLYIACGISGAIQHLAGVSSSKVICVINKDPEAPFFKAADYGIVGDVMEVLPKLTAAVKNLKSNA